MPLTSISNSLNTIGFDDDTDTIAGFPLIISRVPILSSSPLYYLQSYFYFYRSDYWVYHGASRSDTFCLINRLKSSY